MNSLVLLSLARDVVERRVWPKIDAPTDLPRPSLLYFKDHVAGTLARPLVGGEVGVAGGYNAVRSMRLVKFSQFFMIDLYPRGYLNKGVCEDYGPCERAARQRAREFPEAVFLRMDSLQAARTIPAMFDFLYLDDDHRYGHVVRELEAWWPRIVPGGVLAGHDFHGDFPGVVRAVVERFGLDRVMTGRRDWWVVKGG